MKIIKQDATFEGTRTKGSRFIAFVFAVQTRTDCAEKLAQVRQQHPNASHICYAWILSNEGSFYSDDGEPTGSAGRPILQHVQGRNLTNVLAVSVRYFGGTKLGVGGLIRAYGNSIALVLDMVELEEDIVLETMSFFYDYDVQKHIQKIVSNHSDMYVSVEHQYREQICTQIQVPLEHVFFIRQQLIEGTSGRIIFVD